MNGETEIRGNTQLDHLYDHPIHQYMNKITINHLIPIILLYLNLIQLQII